MDRISPHFGRRLVDLTLVALVATVGLAAAVSLLAPVVGLRPLVIRGSSMEPSIPRGSLVLAEDGSHAVPTVGDVVSFREPNGIVVTHRVLEVASTPVEGILLTTKGDANPTADPAALPVDRVIGRVVASVPFLGFVSAMLGMPSGIVAIVLLALGLLTLSSLIAEVASDTCPLCAEEAGDPNEAGAAA